MRGRRPARNLLHSVAQCLQSCPLEEPCADEACVHPLADAYSLDSPLPSALVVGRSGRRGGERRTYSLIPTNMEGIPAAAKLHRQLMALPVGSFTTGHVGRVDVAP